MTAPEPGSPVADAGIDHLLDTWANLEKELGERNAEIGSLRLQAVAAEDRARAAREELAAVADERDRLLGAAQADTGQQAEQARQVESYRGQLEVLRAELAAARRQLDDRAAGAEGLFGRRGAESRLADYRDALIGLEHTLGERDRSILQHTTEKAELAARIADLARQVAEITGRWRESDAANVRLQAMLADAVRGAERIEGDLRQARDGADQLARQVAEKSALIATLQAEGVDRQSAQAAGLAQAQELGDAVTAERKRSAALLADLRERDRRLAQLETSVARQRAETEAAREAGAATQKALEEARARLAVVTQAPGDAGRSGQADELRAELEAAREAVAERDARLEELQSRVTALGQDFEQIRDRAGLADASREQRERELEQQLQARDAAISELQARLDAGAAERDTTAAALQARVEQLTAELAAQQAGTREMESELRRQSNANAVLGREVERLKRIETDVRKLDGLMTRHAAAAPAHADAEARRRARLVVSIEGDHTIKYPLYKQSMVIGRAGDADIHVIGRFTSRRHARIVLLEDDTAVIEDLGSLNGIRVNDQAVTRQPLRDGDMLDIGGARLQFIDLGQRESTRSSAG